MLLALLVASCSTTKGVPDGDKLFTGIKVISYDDDSLNQALPIAHDHLEQTMVEVEAALATKPNGSLFGSSSLRSPLQTRLWVWNTFHDKQSGFARWMTRSFGSQPVLMSQVNPALRSRVAESVLNSHGYTQAVVTYKELGQKNAKKGKLSYDVQPGPLMTLDSVEYVGFPAGADSLIRASLADTYLHPGDAFTVSSLDMERQRLSTLLRNRGYYYFQPSYISYLADTVQHRQKALLRVTMADSLPDAITRRWVIGRVGINLRRNFMEQPTDSFSGRRFSVTWNGKRPVLRPRVILGGMRLRPGSLYSYDRYQRTVANINQMGLFSMVDYTFTPRLAVGHDSLHTAADNIPDTLDMTMSCVLDKPYDFYVEGSFTNRTIGRYGPQLKMGLTRRNAFHGGEKLDINIHGSYEWHGKTRGTGMNNYEYGADLSVEFPRLIAPFFGGNSPRMTEERIRQARLRGSKMPNIIVSRTTLAKASYNIIRRPGYYKMQVVGGEWTYRWRTTRAGGHEFSPLTVKYQFLSDYTAAFENLLADNVYLATTMKDHFIPQMRYTYTYTSPVRLLNPIRWETTLSEAGNLTSLYFMAKGWKWNDKNKKMFRTPYAQFVKIETDFTKTWRLGQGTNLVAHLNGGYIHSYGNSTDAPFSEMFYIGGANSVRALPIHGAGPGASSAQTDKQEAYLFANGNLKLQGNLEWRQKLVGGLWGAVFLDAGNVWMLEFDTEHFDDNDMAELDRRKFHFNDFWKRLAIGTGIGLRYDLDFLVLRLDWGVGLHMPYDTQKAGFYNIESFKDSHTLHFAIGYPF